MKKETWRYIVGFLSAAFIIYLWSTKDVAGQYAGMPREQLLPLIVTNVAVTLVKVLAIAGAVWLVRWIAAKGSKRDK